MQIERREGNVEVVLVLESFDLNEADIAPGSDEIRNDEYGRALGRHWELVVVYFCHARIVPRVLLHEVARVQGRKAGRL